VVGYNTNHSSVKPSTVMIDNIAYHNNTNYPSVKPSTVMIDNIAYHNNTNYLSGMVVVGYIVYHYCLRFDRGVVCIVVVGYIFYHYC
jgi:hypothetical protein